MDKTCTANFPVHGPILSVDLPALQKLKVDRLMLNYATENLQSLEFNEASVSCGRNLLKRSLKLEELRMSHKCYFSTFLTHFWDAKANASIKKLVIAIPMETRDEISSVQQKIGKFSDFLTSQRESIEELTFEFFSSMHRDDDPLIKFSQFYKLKKFVIFDKHHALSRIPLASVMVSNIPPNSNIAELRLLFDKSELSDVIFRNLVTASPKLKRLHVRAIDDALLKHCAAHLPKLKTLEIDSLTVESLPNKDIRFKKLKHLSLKSCIIENKLELLQLPPIELEKRVLVLLQGKTTKRSRIPRWNPNFIENSRDVTICTEVFEKSDKKGNASKIPLSHRYIHFFKK